MRGLVVSCFLFASIVGFAQTPELQKEKAEFMLSITRYVRWADRGNIGKTFDIGVVRDNAMAKELSELSDRKTILGRKVRVVEYYKLNDIENCDMLFLSKKVFVNDRTLTFVNSLVKEKPTLIISDRAERVAMINFYVRNYDNSIEYEVNKANIQNAGIIPQPGFLKKCRVKE